MKKIILFTFLLLILPFCKAGEAEFSTAMQYLAIGITNLAKKGLFEDIARPMDLYSKIYLSRLFGSESLDFIECQLIAIPDNLNLPRLKDLSLYGNYITAIPDNLPQLRHLYLNNNRITTIGNLNLPNLQHLDLTNNQIAAINPNVLDQFPNLERLFLSQNHLKGDNINHLKGYALIRNLNHHHLTIDFGEQKSNPNIKNAKKL